MKIYRYARFFIIKDNEEFKNEVLDSKAFCETLFIFDYSKKDNQIYLQIIENLINTLQPYFLEKFNLKNTIKIDNGCNFGNIDIYFDIDTLKEEYKGLFKLDKECFYNLFYNEVFKSLNIFICKK